MSGLSWDVRTTYRSAYKSLAKSIDLSEMNQQWTN